MPSTRYFDGPGRSLRQQIIDKITQLRSRFRLHITALDISTGEPGNPDKCAVARAARRRWPNAVLVGAGTTTIRVVHEYGVEEVYKNTDRQMLGFVLGFDRDNVMRPTTLSFVLSSRTHLTPVEMESWYGR